MPAKQTPEEWLKKYVSALNELAKPFAGDGRETISYGPHTVLKIIGVYYYAGMFAKIATGESAKARGYDAAVYLDLFAGPGLVRIEGTDDYVAGSPVAATSTAFPFDFSVFVEIDKRRSNALSERLSTYLPNDKFVVFNGDSNSMTAGIIKFLKEKYKKPIVLAFIDPQGMEAKWTTAEALTKAFKSIDFMLNVTTGANRVAGRIKGGMVGDVPIFQDFFGANADEILTRINAGEKVEAIYEKGVKDVLGRPLGETIGICETGNKMVYHLLGYTRESWTGSPWAAGFKALKTNLERFDGDGIRAVMDVVKGRQKPLL